MPSSPLALTDLLSWDASYSMSGGLSGNAQFTNQDLQYGVDLLWSSIYITTDTTVSSDLPDPSAFAGTARWLAGTIHSIDDASPTAELTYKINIASFYSTLANKSINTHYYNTTAGTVLLDVLQVYCGVPGALISITAAVAPLVQSVVQGSNVWEECLKLAQCCHSDMFVQVGGDLVIEPWKDHFSAVDFSLPREAIIEVTRVRNVEKGPSRIRLRGRAVSKYDCGPRLVSANPTQAPSNLTKNKCYRNGLGEPTSDLVLKNLGGSRNDLTNAGYILGGDLQFDTMQSADIKEGSAKVHTTPSTGSYLDPASNSVTSYKVLTRNKGTGEITNETNKLRKLTGQLKTHDKALSKLAGVPPGVFTISNKDPNLGGEAGDRDRLEMVVNDVLLQAEFGIVIDEVDNQYVSCGLSAFFIGIRRIQEFLMGRNKFKVSTAYLPVLTINDVITFIITNTDQEITGRVCSINVVGNIDASEVSMDIEVEGFSELPDRTYVSGNLLVYPELCGINGVNWISDSGGVFALSGYFGFEAGASVYQPIFLTTSLVFTLVCDLILISPTGSFKVTDSTSGTSVTITATGQATLVYAPSAANTNLVFEAITGEWFMSNVSLTTSITT